MQTQLDELPPRKKGQDGVNLKNQLVRAADSLLQKHIAITSKSRCRERERRRKREKSEKTAGFCRKLEKKVKKVVIHLFYGRRE